MAITAAQLVAKISVEGAEQSAAQLKGVGAAADAGKLSLGSIAGGVALAAGAAIIGIGAASVKMAGDFQQGMTSLVTGAGESKSNLKTVSDGILSLATQTGTSTKQLTDGMYLIESAGYHGAAGLDVLKSAAEGAKVGNADLGTVANAVTTVLTDYHLKASDATSVTSGLVAAVASGKTHMQDLGNAMGAVLPLASSAGISFPQVAGAISTMTNAGMNAQHASQNLANAIRGLEAPGGAATKALKSVGLSADDVHTTLTQKGLPAALQLIEDHLGKKFPEGSEAYDAAMKSIMGGATGLNVALMIGGKNLDTFKGNIDTITQSMKNGAKDVQGWADVQNTFNFRMDQAKEVVETLMIKLGTALLPVVTNVLGYVANLGAAFITWENNTHGIENALNVVGTVLSVVATGAGNVVTAIGHVVEFFQKNQVAAAALLIPLGALSAVLVQMAVTAIAAFIASIPALIVGFIGWATAAGAAAVATIAATWPILAIGAVIGLVVAGIILAVQHWGQITAWLQGVWQGAISMLSGLWNSLVGIASSVWSAIAGVFASAWGMVSGALSSFWASLSGWFSNLASQAVSFGEQIIQGFITGINNMIGAAGQAAANVVNSVKNFLGFHSPAKEGEGRYIIEWGQGMIEGFAQGIKQATPTLTQTVNQTLALGAQPLRVSPLPLTQQAPTIIVQPAPITIDGRILTDAQMPYIANAIRYGYGTHRQ